MTPTDPADRRLALITGASAGIGQALARVYAEHGWDLVLTARRADRLEALADELKLRAGIEAIVIPEDLADPAAPARLVEAIEARGRTGDALINNAGFSRTEGFQAVPWEQHQAMLTQFDANGDGTLDEVERALLREELRNRFRAGLMPGETAQ